MLVMKRPSGYVVQWSERVTHWKLIFWRPLVAWVLTVASVLSFLTWIRDEFSPKGAISRIADLLPSWSPWVWLALAFVTLLVIALEGSFRNALLNETHISTLRAEVHTLHRRLEHKGPKVAVRYEKASIHDGFYISTDQDILDLRVTSPAANCRDLPYIIKAETSVPLEFFSERKIHTRLGFDATETDSDFRSIFNNFCSDQLEVKISLNLRYRDHYGNEYEVRWVVVWNPVAVAWDEAPRIEQDPHSYRWVAPEAPSRD